jgi:hypothetical protein
VNIYSKLLHRLDQAVTADPLSVGEAVLDKSYMAQLVEVQHRRGATGGQMFVQVVQLEQPRLPGLWQDDSECSRKHMVDRWHKHYSVLSEAYSALYFCGLVNHFVDFFWKYLKRISLFFTDDCFTFKKFFLCRSVE